MTILNNATSVPPRSGNWTSIDTNVFDVNSVLSFVDIVVNCYLIHVVSLIGIISNIFNIIVLSKHSFQETTNILLLSLSICDLLCSVLQPVRRIHSIVERFNPVVGLTVKSFTTAYLFLLPDFFVSVSILHTSVIAVERLVAVCFPLQVSRIFTSCRVKWAVLFLYILAFGILSPTLFLTEFTWAYDSKLNTTRGAVILSKFYLDHMEFLTGYACLGATHFFATCPVIFILSCSALTAFKLTAGRRIALPALTPSSATTTQRRELKVIKMLLTVCAVNVSVAIPAVIINMFLLYLNTSVIFSSMVPTVLRSVIGLLYQFIATVNFFIYVSMSSKFAKMLNKWLCQKENAKKCK